MDFGYLLRTLRISAGFGLRQLAREIGLSPTYLSLVENGKLPPPTAARIAQIEQALNVPVGHLLPIAHGRRAELDAVVNEIPEAVSLLKTARDEAMTATDIGELTAFLRARGWTALRQAMQSVVAVQTDAVSDRPSRSAQTHVWPFLDESLIFDMDGSKGKAAFLKEAVARMAGLCGRCEADALLKELVDREDAASTGIGDGVAIPHAYTTALDNMVVALARIPGGLDYDAIDGRPVKMAVVLAGPRSTDNLHMKLMSEVATLVSRGNFRESVLGAPSPADVISLFRSAEMGSIQGSAWPPTWAANHRASK